MICNQFVNAGCNNDFLINEGLENPPYQPGIAYNQRNAANISNGTQEPAGNIFTFNHGTDTTVVNYDINIENSVSSILYTHHTTSTILNIRLKPDKVSDSSKVAYVAFPDFPFDSTDSCPNGFYPEGPVESIKESINESDYKADSLSTLLKMLIDAGSTDSLKTIVDYSFSAQSYELYQNLMTASPYLSDTVVKASIKKEDVLPNAMIRDIMVANPQSAKSEELLTTLDNRMVPMPDSMWVEILQGIDIVGAKERLEDELAGWLQRRDLHFNALAFQYLTDTVNSWASDSLIALYQSDNRLSSRYWLVQYYLDHSKFSQATAILQNIPSEFELNDQQEFSHQHIVSLVNLLPRLFADTMGFLIPDSSTCIILEEIANEETCFPGAWARNVLISCNLLDYQEPILFESNYKSSGRKYSHFSKTVRQTPEFFVFPNPAKDFVILCTRNISSEHSAILTIIDMQGRQVGSIVLSLKAGQQVVPLRDMPSGTYVFKVFFDNTQMSTVKVVVSP
ncbi:MAG: T9SS type A sorting domain-containing protein [Alphaproteobacteria bacterium]|nr:T9SS type A sorting domain-containing protein [Alphaproteobacteria bacterium]